ADWELIGVPLRVTLGDRGLKEGVVEIQARRETQARRIAPADAVTTILETLKSL
ncbi:MAG TPA: His/Gly/Thr/Pro-type tRNA ligase C-terminal domain-containing protein, partial [Castellaniella sp.]|nr:His/Gly/Thr/Pro-type tRNA ligase C-terminal domain-containing protein [Castellaniella sp.]